MDAFYTLFTGAEKNMACVDDDKVLSVVEHVAGTEGSAPTMYYKNPQYPNDYPDT